MIGQNDAHAEAGDLGHAFDAGVEELDRVRKECEAHSRELQQRNRELAATAAIAQATSTDQLDLDGMLERALEVVLEVTGLPAGWILLLPQIASVRRCWLLAAPWWSTRYT